LAFQTRDVSSSVSIDAADRKEQEKVETKISINGQTIMAKKQKRTKKSKEPKQRNAAAVAASARNSAGYIKPRNEKRKTGRNSWRKFVQKLIDGE
jgi:hypothetical protein